MLAAAAALGQLGLEQRRHRRHARGAQRGRQRGRERDDQPDHERHDDRARLDHHAGVGQVDPEALKIAFRPAAKPMPANTPSTAPSTPMIGASQDHPGQDLAARGAQRAQQAELADALRDGDRERVEDQEAADQQRHAAEHEQDHAEEAEVVLDVLRLARGGLLPGLDDQRAAAARGRCAWPAAAARRRARPAPRCRRARPTLSVRRCASGSVSWAVLEPPDEVSPSRWSPTIWYALHARLGGDPQRAADLEVLAVGGRGVDRGLVGGARRPPLDVGERVERLRATSRRRTRARSSS